MADRGLSGGIQGGSSPLAEDGEYAAVVARERPLLQSCAYLLTGQEGRADRLVELVLARLYERWGDVAHPRVEALRELVQTSPHDPMLPWDTRPRIELIDGSRATAPGPPIVADLQRLPTDQRAVLVLERFAELPSVQIAAVVGRTVDEVLVLARTARAALSADHPDRAQDPVLAEELREAVPPDRREAADPNAADLVHGRRLVRRRRGRRAIAAAAAVAVLGAGFVVLRPAAAPVVAPAPVPVPTVSATPTGIPVTCDVSDPRCRTEVLGRWRAEMALVVGSYLDPGGAYLSGAGGRAEERFETPGFWTGQDGALGVVLFRVDGGSTEVFLQVATSRPAAVRCGGTIGRTCYRQKFLDGNFFNLTDTVNVVQGMEVQHRPTGEHVVTVIARNVRTGPSYDIPRGDLIRLVQDPRLRLPEL